MDVLRVGAMASLAVRSLVRLHKITVLQLITLWRKLPVDVRMHRQRQRSTTRISRVDRDMGVRLAGDIQVRIYQLPTQGNTMIIDRLESR